MTVKFAQAQAAPTDDELAALARRREADGRAPADAEDAFARLRERHLRALASYLAARGGRHDVDDLLQDTWVRVWEHLPTGFRGGNFRAWVFEIARHLLVDHVRKRRPDPIGNREFAVGGGRTGSPEAIVLERERAEALNGCLKLLAPEAATVVRARLHDESYEEICRKFGWKSTGQAHKLFHMAKKELQTCLERKLK
jgi:RNA polymerase sigma factor (sigma-70 family)